LKYVNGPNRAKTVFEIGGIFNFWSFTSSNRNIFKSIDIFGKSAGKPIEWCRAELDKMYIDGPNRPK
jgi:hypothetical protein